VLLRPTIISKRSAPVSSGNEQRFQGRYTQSPIPRQVARSGRYSNATLLGRVCDLIVFAQLGRRGLAFGADDRGYAVGVGSGMEGLSGLSADLVLIVNRLRKQA